MKKYIVSGLLAAGLVACSQAPAPETAAAGPSQVLGLVKFEFKNIGSDNFTVTATPVADLSGQALTRPPGVTVTGRDRGVFYDGGTGARYLYGRFNVTTNSPRINVTLLGVNLPGSGWIGDTSFYDVRRRDGAQASQEEARQLKPLNRRIQVVDPNTGDATPVVFPSGADFQAYKESDISALNSFVNSRYGGTVFPFGFVARNGGVPLKRDIAPGDPGTVTTAFRVPAISDATNPSDIISFVWYGLITQDDQFRVSRDFLEPDSNRQCDAVTGLNSRYGTGVVVATLAGQGTTNCGNAANTPENVGTVRIAGSPGAATAVVP